MRYHHVDFNTWRLSGGNAGHLAELTGKASFDDLEAAKDAEEARDALDQAACEFMFNCEVEKDAAQSWGLQYDGDACGGDGGYIDEDGDEYANVYEHHGAGAMARDACAEIEEVIAREMFAGALLSGGQELKRAAAWAGLIKDPGGMDIYNRFYYADTMPAGMAIIEAATEADSEHLDPQTIIALAEFLDGNEKAELMEIIKTKHAQARVDKALDVRPGYYMRRYRDRAAELVDMRREKIGWIVIEHDTNGRALERTQCRTKADAMREVSDTVLALARQATQQFAMYGRADID